MSQNPDQHYIDLVLSGRLDAYSVLIDRYKYMVFTIAVRIVKNREDAEEISQDVFVKAFHALDTYKGNAAFSTWLYKIAYRKGLDHLKKHQKKSAPKWVDLSEGRTLVEMDTVLDRMIDRERKAVVRNTLESLSAEDRLMITLYYYEELSLKEIASVLEIEVNAAKVRLHRSRERLAKLLGKTMEPDLIVKYGKV